jgi:hypothetical protein
MVVNYSGFICSRLVCIVAFLGLLVVLCVYCCRTCRTVCVLLYLLYCVCIAVLVVLCVYCCTCCTVCVLLYLYYVGIAGVTLDAELLARSQYSEGPATGHLDTGFSWFHCVYKQMLRWLLCFQVATTCFSCSPPGLKLNVSVASFICLLHVKWPLPPGDSPIAVNNNNNNYYYYYWTLNVTTLKTTKVPQRRGPVVRPCAVMVTFRSRSQECIAWQKTSNIRM